MSNQNFKEKVVIITGGGGTLGGSMAEAFAEAGAHLVLLGRRIEVLEQQRKQLLDKSEVEVLCLPCDVTDKQQLIIAREEILDRFNSIDILINAAGGNLKGATIGPDQTFLDLEIPDFEKVTDLNLMGTLLPCMVFGEVMAEKKRGAILNISSMAADRVITRVIGYSASKAAVENLTRSLAVELAKKFGDGLRVNALAPGFFIAEQNKSLLIDENGKYTQRGKTIIKNTPMNRFGRKEEIQGAALFLCSEQASFITGTVLEVDGGFSAFSGV